MDRDGGLDVGGDASFYDASNDPFVIIRAHLVWYESDGATPPAFVAHEIEFSNVSTVTAARAADMDGDGDTDLAAAWNGTDTVAWYENGGAAAPTFFEAALRAIH